MGSRQASRQPSDASTPRTANRHSAFTTSGELVLHGLALLTATLADLFSIQVVKSDGGLLVLSLISASSPTFTERMPVSPVQVTPVQVVAWAPIRRYMVYLCLTVQCAKCHAKVLGEDRRNDI